MSMTYQRIVCSVDGSPGAIEVAQQAIRIADPSSSMLLLTAIEYALDALWDAPQGERLATATRLQREAEELVEGVRRTVETKGTIETRVIEGSAKDVILAQVAADPECLLALEPPDQGRLKGIVAGNVATDLLHTVSCSVLLARESADRTFPRLVVVGLDGSAESDAAFAVALDLRKRYGTEIRPIAAGEGKGLDIEAVQQIVGDMPFTVDGTGPVAALRSASDDADLVIVGSRGLHGARALGSVSERVAHQAGCSVLVVRRVAAGGE